ncbi:LysR family transcriptional regulator [Burkholderia cenocepacia]|uniref:LysR family transcriptional regulator n=1 Tax=Burkholderia cenocepacia TaxID=95486 RepID=UPI000752E7CC|nr:LysR family transcriptional regulator [Burkholderia cenocepacia]AOK36241.1 transcriptional regulator [Burkholderia cenocepacia]KWF64058.1 transcriptional regulator [Burkholderia cenocepacia]
MAGLSLHNLTRRVDLFTLRLFLTVVEEQQMRRAALRENITPSAATRRIQDLEEIAGIDLFERLPGGMVPSAAGEVLARHVRLLFANLDVMRREVAEFTEGVRGQIRISSTSTIIVQFLAREIAEFTRDFPLVDIELQEDANSSVVGAVVSGKADVAMFYATDDIDRDALEVIEYRTDRLVAVVPKGHMLSERASVTTRDLLEQNIIGLSATTSMMTQLKNAAASLGHELVVKYRVSTIEAARSLVKAGLGVTIHPESMLPLEDFTKVTLVALDEQWALRRLCIGTKRGDSLPAATKAFVAQLTDR